MQKLRTPLLLTAIYILLIGLSTLSGRLAGAIYGYEVRDPGVLRILSASFLGFGVVLWAVSADPEKHGGLTTSVVAALAIFIIFLLWGWGTGLYTARNVLLPLIIDVVLGAWLWSAKARG